jgi:hypothetical protein
VDRVAVDPRVEVETLAAAVAKLGYAVTEALKATTGGHRQSDIRRKPSSSGTMCCRLRFLLCR